MKKRWVIIPIVTLFLFLAACSSSNKSETPKTTTQQLSAEETLFKNHCATCHGGNLEGGYGPALQQVGKTYTKEQILEVMKNGKGTMPSQSFIPTADQEKLATWLSNKK